MTDYLGDIARGAGSDACRDLSRVGTDELIRLSSSNGEYGSCRLLAQTTAALIAAQGLRPVHFTHTAIHGDTAVVRVAGSDDAFRLHGEAGVWRIDSLPLENHGPE